MVDEKIDVVELVVVDERIDGEQVVDEKTDVVELVVVDGLVE